MGIRGVAMEEESVEVVMVVPVVMVAAAVMAEAGTDDA